MRTSDSAKNFSRKSRTRITKNIQRKITALIRPTGPSGQKLPSSPLEGNSLVQMISNFIDHTGITLVSYVGTRNSILWKSIWLLVIACGFTMTIIQSNDAIHDYFGYAILLRTTFELNGSMQFPAVTVCSNSPVNWEHEKNDNTTIFQEVMIKLNDEVAKEAYAKDSLRKGRSYEEYVLLEVLSKYYITQSNYTTGENYGVLTKLYWNGDTYTNKKSSQNYVFKKLEDEGIMYLTRDFLYGDCVIFNAQIDLSKSLTAAALTGAEFTLQWDLHTRYPYSSDPSIIVVIHPVGTPPILDDSNNIKVNPGDEVSIAIQQREINRLPAPFPSYCLDRNDPQLQSNSVYYQYDRHYLFSMEACIKTCMQRISLRSCDCWDAQIPLGFLRRQSRRSPPCKIERCDQIDKQLTSQFCRCKLPCRETLLESTLTIKSGFLKEIAKRAVSENETESMEFSSGSQQQQNVSKVKVFIKSAVYESIKEEPKYTVADFWGIIGGNAGLWIGISAVSLFEVVELICVMIKSKIQRLIWKKKAAEVQNNWPKNSQVRNFDQSISNKIARDDLHDYNLRNKSYKFLPEF